VIPSELVSNGDVNTVAPVSSGRAETKRPPYDKYFNRAFTPVNGNKRGTCKMILDFSARCSSCDYDIPGGVDTVICKTHRMKVPYSSVADAEESSTNSGASFTLESNFRFGHWIVTLTNLTFPFSRRPTPFRPPKIGTCYKALSLLLRYSLFVGVN